MLQCTQQGDALTVHLCGEIDHCAAEGLRNEIEMQIVRQNAMRLILDFSQVTFMDSSGVAVILRLHKRMRDMGGRIWVENPRAQPLRVIDISGVDRIVKICTTIKE